jgi:hypothetical protein
VLDDEGKGSGNICRKPASVVREAGRTLTFEGTVVGHVSLVGRAEAILSRVTSYVGMCSCKAWSALKGMGSRVETCSHARMF